MIPNANNQLCSSVKNVTVLRLKEKATVCTAEVTSYYCNGKFPRGDGEMRPHFPIVGRLHGGEVHLLVDTPCLSAFAPP